MDWKFKVPCDDFGVEVIDGLLSGDEEVNERVGVYYGGDDNFPQEIFLKEGRLYFEFQATDPVAIWGYAKDLEAAQALVDYLAYRMGEVPEEVYDRWIFEV
jgi:hypothetical protein